MCKTKLGAELSSSSLCWGWSWDQVGLDSLLVAVTLCYKSALNNRCCIILVSGAEGGFQVLVSTKTFDQGRLRRGCILGRPFIMKKYFEGLEDKSERNGKEKNHFLFAYSVEPGVKSAAWKSKNTSLFVFTFSHEKRFTLPITNAYLQ